MKLILPCYYQNKTTKERDDLGLDSDNSHYDVARVILYAVHAVTRVLEDDGTLTSKVWIPCGDTFCVPLKPKEVEALIDEAMEKGSADGFAIWKEN